VAARWRYLIALGSNVRHPRHGPPRAVLEAALVELERRGLAVTSAASIIETHPIGPSIRRYANSAAVIESELDPPELLALLKRAEQDFGRRPRGEPWRARVLDLDIVLWSGGAFASDELTIPHPLFRTRAFVLLPAAEIAPGWRDPISGKTVRQLRARLTRPRAGHR
jgi:2-amino-4-hydroxy-6-hydroxymethyldihydropteridine diphosphokinase